MTNDERVEFDRVLGIADPLDQAAALVAFDEVEFRRGVAR